MKKLPQALALASTLAYYSVTANSILIPFNGLNQLIPDGDSSGFANQQFISLGSVGNITDVNVRINLAGVGGDGFNGDLYAWLKHDSGFSVLLSRPGKTASDSTGYADNGLNVVLDDAGAKDIHNYRDFVAGPFPLTSPLGGTWTPDGRTSDPGAVLDTDSRTSFLSSFNGLNPSGNWTLFVADLETGGQVQLRSWALDIQTDALTVPDSMNTLLGLAGSICLLCLLRPTRRIVKA